MSSYTCYRCGYESKYKCNMRTHLERIHKCFNSYNLRRTEMLSKNPNALCFSIIRNVQLVFVYEFCRNIDSITGGVYVKTFFKKTLVRSRDGPAALQLVW